MTVTTGAQFTVGVPEPRLRPLLGGDAVSYTGYVEPAAPRRREVPGSRLVLIVGLADPLTIADGRAGTEPQHTACAGPHCTTCAGPRYTSFVGGLFDGPVVVGATGVSAGVQVDLAPELAYRLLGVPLGELSNRVVALDDLLGAGVEERVADAGTWAGRFTVLDGLLGARLSAGPRLDPRLAWAWRRLVATGGRVRVGELAHELGWSSRHLTRRFQHAIGLPPKAAARVLRFERAWRMLVRAGAPAGAAAGAPAGAAEGTSAGAAEGTSAGAAEGTSAGAAEVAARCGYYDQAHLIREFRELAGGTPGQLVAARLGGGGLAAG